jgi:uncharacterized protein YrrD
MTVGRLVRAADVIGLPVVTIDGGDDIAEIKDVVYDGSRHVLVGFTLNKRGWLAGNFKAMLAADNIAAIGGDAVMVDTAADLVDANQAPSDLADTSPAHPMLGSSVLSADGNELGEIVGVIIETSDEPAAVGYEVRGGDATVFVPISAQMAISDDNLIVPANATEFVRNDLAGFGAAVESFRTYLSSDTEGA